MLNREKFVYKILTINEWEDFKKNFFFMVQSLINHPNSFIFHLYHNYLRL